jgi:hypothetical protein
MNCSKNFTLEVTSGGPDWDSMAWIITSEFAIGSATNTTNFNGHIVTQRTQTAFFGVAERYIEGTLVYGGGAANCNLNLLVTITSIIPAMSPDAIFSGSFQVYLDDGMGPVLILDVVADVNWNNYNVLSSSSDFPFVVTGPGTITVIGSWRSASTDTGTSVDEEGIATLTNLP